MKKTICYVRDMRNHEELNELHKEVMLGITDDNIKTFKNQKEMAKFITNYILDAKCDMTNSYSCSREIECIYSENAFCSMQLGFKSSAKILLDMLNEYPDRLEFEGTNRCNLYTTVIQNRRDVILRTNYISPEDKFYKRFMDTDIHKYLIDRLEQGDLMSVDFTGNLVVVIKEVMDSHEQINATRLILKTSK